MKNQDKMTRWAKSQPSLRMADGGAMFDPNMVQAAGMVQHYSPMMAMPGSLAMADGGGLPARPLETGPKPNPLTPGKPQTPVPNWFHHSLRGGGPVPGEGEGDKIPAMLEPEEFVVSNSMMERKPGLRDALHSIRDETLVAEGKDPRAVDAKQARQTTLRALEGVDVTETWNKNIPKNGWSQEASDWRAKTNPTGPNMPTPEPAGAAPKASKIFSAGESVGNGIRSAGEAVGGGLKTAGEATGGALKAGAKGIAKSLLSPSNPIGAVTAGFGPNAMAYGDDSISTGDKLRLMGGGLLQTAGTMAGGVFGAGVGSVVPGPGTVAGAIGGSIAGSKGSRWLAQKAFGTDDILRSHGYDPDRDMVDMGIDAVKGKGIRDVFGGHAGVTPSDGGSWGREARGVAAGGSAMLTPGQGQGQTTGPTQSQASGPMGPPTDPNAIRVERQANGTTSFSGGTVGFNPDGGNSYIGPGSKGLRSNPISVMPADAGKAIGANSDALRAGLDAAAARGDMGAVRQYYADKGETFAGVTPEAYRAQQVDASAPKRGEFGFNRYQANKVQQDQIKAQLRGQDITSADSRYGHQLSTEVSRNRLRYDMNKDQRDYNFSQDKFKAERGDKGLEQNQAADKAWTDHTASVFRTKDDKGNDVPDTQKAAAFTQAVDETLSQFVAELGKSSDPKIRAHAEDLSKRGRAALDAEDRGTLQMLFERQQTHGATADSIGPLNSSGPKSKNLMDYRIKGKDGDAWFQNRQKTVGGQSIPDVDLRYGPNANRILPNLGAGSNYATPNRLRGE